MKIMTKLWALLLVMCLCLSLLPSVALAEDEVIDVTNAVEENVTIESVDTEYNINDVETLIGDEEHEPWTDGAIGYGTGDWSNGWSWWSQGQSAYSGVRGYGCLIVAQAKMLAASGIANSDTSSFNPDIWYEWEVNNGYVNSGMYTTDYSGPSAYAGVLGKNLKYEGVSYGSDTAKVWENINADKYTIIRVYTSGTSGSHYILVNNDASLLLGRLRVFESWDSSSIPGTRDLSSSYTVREILTYSMTENSSTPSVSFETNSYQDIGESEIVLGKRLTLSGATLWAVSAVGIDIYDASGTWVAGKSEGLSVSDSYKNNYNYVDMWYYLVSELGMTLYAGNYYTYQFYAIINDTTYYSSTESFTVPGGVPAPTITNVSVSGSSVSVYWTASSGATYYDVYLIQEPWNWADVKYSANTTGTSYTFDGVSGGHYCAFVISRPNDATVQSNWEAFDVLAYYTLDVNGYLDSDSNAGSIEGYGTFDVYINGSLVADDVSDYYTSWPSGTTYQIADIRSASGKAYSGLYSGSLSGTIGSTLDVRLIFKSTYTITYNANGGTGAPDAQTKTYGEALALSSTVPTRTGYTFLGWATSSTATSATYSAGGSYTANAAATLYAVWSLGGSCGDNVTWTLDTETGVLTISGTGAMEDYSSSSRAPWYDYRTSIKTVSIQSGVTAIGDNAFAYCTSLTSVTIPDSVTSIGICAFELCTSLTSVMIGNGVTSIGSGAFSNCTSLTSVTIPDSVTSIGGWAFVSCTSLASVTIPDSVTSIGYDAFSGCTSLTSIDVSANNSQYASQDGVLFNKAMTELICCPGGKSGVYTIPDSVTSIGDNAFDGCTSLTSLTIPDSVTSIGDYAFNWCVSLTSVTFTGDAPSIGMDAFSGVTATAYYPANNETWTTDVMQDYSGTITWVSYGDDAVTYTITYDANGGESAPDAQIKTDGETLTLSSTIPTRDGYTFLGWATSSTATTATYQPGDSYTADSAATLYAVWKEDEGEIIAPLTLTGNYNKSDKTVTLHVITTREISVSSLEMTLNGWSENFEVSEITWGPNGFTPGSTLSSANVYAYYNDDELLPIEAGTTVATYTLTAKHTLDGDYSFALTVDVATDDTFIALDWEGSIVTGTVTIGMLSEEDFSNLTKGLATIEYTTPTAGDFTVSCTSPCIVIVTDGTGESIALSATGISDDTYSYTLPNSYDTTQGITVAVRGDITGDSRVNTTDARVIMLVKAGSRVLTDTEKLIIDITGDNKVNTSDARMIMLIKAGRQSLSW